MVTKLQSYKDIEKRMNKPEKVIIQNIKDSKNKRISVDGEVNNGEY